MSDTNTVVGGAASPEWHRLSAGDATTAFSVDAGSGLTDGEVRERLSRYGPNEIASEPPPTWWDMAKGQLANPMNIMLLIAAVASFVIDQVSTGIVIGVVVTFNVAMGANQERTALASVEALSELQVPRARVRRDGRVQEVEAAGLVPGDVVLLEAGDLVPADARILTSASLEAQDAALTGESAPVGALFPYLGWVLLGWGLTWAAVEFGMFQRVLDTVSLAGDQWLVVIALALISPLFVTADKWIQLRALDR